MTARTTRFVKSRPVALYFVLAYAIAWTGCLAIIGPAFIRGEPVAFSDLALMAVPMFFAPTIAGVAMTLAADGRAGLRELSSRMRLWRVGARWYATMLIFPAMILACLLPLSGLVSPDFTPHIFLLGIAIGLMAGCFEELGWTGFAYPRMRKEYGVLGAALIVGLLQTAWHGAADFLGAAGARGSFWLPHFILFMISMMAMRVLLVWVYENTGSVLAAQLMHASSTGFLSIMVPLSLSPAQDTLFYGAYCIALWAVVALVLSVHGRTLQKERQAIPAGLRPAQDRAEAGSPGLQGRTPGRPARSRP